MDRWFNFVQYILWIFPEYAIVVCGVGVTHSFVTTSAISSAPMALTLQQQHQSLAGDNPSQMPASILLNSSNRQYSFTLRAPSQRYPASSSASSTMSSQSDASSSPADDTTYSAPLHPTGRRILVKFAPLPDPRKLEEDNNPLSPTSDEEETYEVVRRGTSGGFLGVSGLSPSSARTTLDGEFGSSGGVTDSKQQRSPRWSTKRLLRPLLPKSSHGSSPTRPDTPSNSTLFRPSSIDSTSSTQSAAPAVSGGAGSGTFSAFSNRLLGHRSRSTSDLESQRERAASSSSHVAASGSSSGSRTLLAKMTPLTQSISESAMNAAPSASPSSTSIRRTRSNSSNAATGTASRRRFMLNGRVYGSRRGSKTPDPFSHQLAYEQPFVEWGSGGLGSVASSRAAGAVADWDRVKAGGTAYSSVSSNRPAEDEDDGSGMGWVRRRREARERAKREEEEARAKGRQQAQSEAASARSTSDSAPPTAPSEHATTPPLTADEPVPPVEGLQDAVSSQYPGLSEPASHSSSPHISRPHSSSTIRNPNSTDGPVFACSTPIPQIVIDPARFSNNVTPVLSSSTLHSSSADSQSHQANDTYVSASALPSQPHPYTEPEHMTEMAVVRPRLPHRRSNAGPRNSYHSHVISTHEERSDVSSSPDDGGENEPDRVRHEYEPDKDDAATLRSLVPPRSSTPRRSMRRRVDSEASSASSEQSTEEDEDEDEDDSEIDRERDDENDEDDEEDEVSPNPPPEPTWSSPLLRFRVFPHLTSVNELQYTEAQKRLTAECAGIEKISRHRERDLETA
jgi:hypothetical protein